MPVWLIVLLPALAAQAVMWPVVTRLHYRNFVWQEAIVRDFAHTQVPWDTETRVAFSALISFLWPAVLFGWGFYYTCRAVALYAVKPSRAEARRARTDYTAAEAELARVTAEIEGKVVK